MEPTWISNIKETIKNFKDYIPKGNKLFDGIENMDIDKLLSTLKDVFDQEEKAILAENKNKYTTDTYENNFIFFTRQLIISLISSHNKLKGKDVYNKLIRQRHIAYSFYINLEYNAITSEKGDEILADLPTQKLLYSGLVEFYNKFYGSFSDNQNAIKLLCKFFPINSSLFYDKNDIVNAIYRHITNAGTPSDSGYAFRGIELIRENIGYLSLDVVDLLLKRYQLYNIINQKVYRNQVFTIINNADIATEEEKQKYKFFYLDSLILANSMNYGLYQTYAQHEHLIRNYLHLEENLSVNKIGLIITDQSEDVYAYWTNICSVDRHFIVADEVLINMHLNIAEKQIVISYSNNPNTEISFEYVYEDWMLNHYHSKETEQKMLVFINNSNRNNIEYTYRPLRFSLLYLNRYRGLHEQFVDFDHQFTYDKNNMKLTVSSNSNDIPHFYGEMIHSLSCIVGKNGTGKTSTIDFLRGTFFQLIYLIHEKLITCKNGYVSESDYKAYDIVDNNSEFLVVFHLGDDAYYLTNVNGVTATNAKAFDHNAYTSSHELSKVVYFSNMLGVNQNSLFSIEELILRDEGNRDNDEEEEEKRLKNNLIKTLVGFRQADYSESSSFIEKREALKTIEEMKKNPKPNKKYTTVSKDLCYQLVFLEYISQNKMEELFDFPKDKNLFVRSRLIESAKTVLLGTKLSENLKSLQQFLTIPDAKLEHFSSGQYAKFSFLAKLYWFLEGYQKYSDYLNTFIGNNVFSSDDALQKGETSLLFIDEGELYYHPEWQRNFIKIIIDLIHQTITESESKIQVVITTNSPFIISDILMEDITYLSKENKVFDQTFGQNIHKLLKDNFFMNYTIGEYSRELISKIMNWLCSKEGEVNIGEQLSHYFDQPITSGQYFEKIHSLINKIGEPVYREKLLETLNQTEWIKDNDLDLDLDLLLRQREHLDSKIKKIMWLKESE
ncbi:AAA family ATPase [Paenibacillus illinoisensis]|uniref:AAA family ATPase n=1 Tax=Paenibacillus illinoisensis TaxID=59845 RepID=UPI00301D9A6D